MQLSPFAAFFQVRDGFSPELEGLSPEPIFSPWQVDKMVYRDVLLPSSREVDGM